MSSPVWSKWLIVAGVLTAALGIILYTQLDWVNEVAISLKSFALLGAAETTSLVMTVVGLLVALTGGVIWARHARLTQLPIPTVSVALLALLLTKFVNINMHGPTAIFTFVIPATLAMAALLFLIAAGRFLQSRRQQQR
jgi:hypothetical protein